MWEGREQGQGPEQGQEQASLGGALSGVFNCIFWGLAWLGGLGLAFVKEERVVGLCFALLFAEVGRVCFGGACSAVLLLRDGKGGGRDRQTDGRTDLFPGLRSCF